MIPPVLEYGGGPCKTYLVWDEGSREAAAIDPLHERIDRALALLAYRGLRLRFAIDTHTHADHRSGARALADLCGATLVMHRLAPSPAVARHVEDGDVLMLGETRLRVLHTPGHTPDAVCVVADGHVFTGDTLLIRGTGRTDLGGDPEAQFDSLHDKVLALPDATIVWPGHDYRGREQSTIGEERRENPRLRVTDRAAYAALMRGLNLPLPTNIQEALQANSSALDPEGFAFPETARLAAVRERAAPELAAALASGEAVVVLDVRETEERTGELGHIKGSRHIPLRELPARAGENLAPDATIVAVCRSGSRSATAAALLTGLGFRHALNLRGGMIAWLDAGLPVAGRGAT
ncbi:MAG: MBL fold metallo-hydrolase [Myxococcota bacterium]